MKAARDITLSNTAEKRQTEPPKEGQTTGPMRLDTIYAHIRRQNARIADLEAALSTVRRDINRISRKQYRDDEPPSDTTKIKAGIQSGFNPEGEKLQSDFRGLFGIE